MRMKLNAGSGLLVSFLVFSLLFPSSADGRKKKQAEAPKQKTIYEIDTLVNPIPRNRELWHDKFHNALKTADARDGKVDRQITIKDDTLGSRVITQALMVDARHLDTMVENLPIADRQEENMTKIGYLRNLENMVNRYLRDPKPDPFFYRKVIPNMQDLIIARHEKHLDEFVHNNANFYTLSNVEMLDGYPELRAYLYSTLGKAEPLAMIRRLREFATEPFACDVIAAAARVSPNEVYKYASSTDITLSGAIRRCNDPLVQKIGQISSQSKAPLKAMSFISDIYGGRLSIADVDVITANDDLFYKNLVRLKLQGDTLGGATYTDELQYRGLKYVTRMNELHEENNPAIRFKCIDGFTPEELYFLMVFGQDQIYTSSFIGTFNRMMERMVPTTGDELLDKVHYEHFRTFIRMCAGYSKLSAFLATMKPDEKTAVMRDFIGGLEKGKPDDLEDAVDVADAFGSIDDSSLAAFLRQEIVDNYTRVSGAGNLKGTIVYGLLATLSRSDNSAELSQSLRLPPINMMPYKSLVNDSGVVCEQVFFYGDEDGRNSYQSFMQLFTDAKAWKVETGPQWTTITSITGKPIKIFANLPLDYEAGKDEEAQKALKKWMATNNVNPTVVVHRGHSYHLSSTIENMDRPNRIIILGSCGGYHNLGKVLDNAPDAQLISTKQTGTMVANNAIIKVMNNHLLAGDDINWITLWTELETTFKGKGKDEDNFREYVPPHRNLGAIFIKAYRRMFNEQEAM
jgi:hypothetical protein